MRGLQTSGIPRGIKAASMFLLTLTLSAGILTGSTSWASGVSANSDAQAMATQAYSYPLQFDASLENSLVELQGSDPQSSAAAGTFYASYVNATKDYGATLLTAADVYAARDQTDPAGAKNAYIDSFGNARAAYFGKLEAARNTVVGSLSGVNDPAKDMFVNEYNSARDTYNNQLESVKNEIAALQ